MNRVVERAHLHAAAASGAQVIVNILGGLDYHRPVAVPRAFERFDSSVLEGSDERVAGYAQVQGAKLEVDVIGPF